MCVCGDGGGSWEEVHCCRAVQLLFFFFFLFSQSNLLLSLDSSVIGNVL